MKERTNQQISAASYLLLLIRCRLNGEAVPEKPEGITWRQLFAESKRQNLLLLAYESIQKLEKGPEGEDLQCWQTWQKKLLTKSISQTIALKELEDTFHSAKIPILPLKGYYLRQTYPAPELREMTDIDLFVGQTSQEMCRQAMESAGYHANGVDHEVHTNYVKLPYVMVELHKKLLPDYVGHGDYYADVWSKAVSKPESPYVYHLSPSDTFIHIMLHFYKHYEKNASCGIRFAVDFFTYCRYYEAQLDWQYIKQELSALGVWQIAEDMLGLSKAWFGDGTMTPQQAQMGERLIRSGVFGNAAGRDFNRIMSLTPKNGNVRIGKLRYFMTILFPPLSEMQLSYPCLQKAPILLPFTWLLRGIRTVFKKPQNIKKYYRDTKNAVPESANKS